MVSQEESGKGSNPALVPSRVGKTESNWGWIPDWWIVSTNAFCRGVGKK